MRPLRRLATRIFGRQEGSDEPVRWSLGWAGAVGVVVAGFAAIVLVGKFWYEPSGEWELEQSEIRAYYGTERGGDAPSHIVRRVHVLFCENYDETYGYKVHRCDLAFGELRPHPCFQFTAEGVRRGPRQLPPIGGCTRFVYDPARKTMRVLSSA